MSFKAVKQNCSRRHVKGEKTTNNTKIVANMLAAAATAAAAAATSTYAATIIIANIIDHTFMIFFLVGKGRHKGKKATNSYSPRQLNSIRGWQQSTRVAPDYNGGTSLRG